MKNTKKITLLHNNDLHGDFLAEKTEEKEVGGISLLSGFVNKVRSEEKNVLYAIAGDMFRGSVIDSEYKGMSTIEIMNALGPDVATIGNHEVDYGISHLLFIEKCAQFPIINANIQIKSNGVRLFDPCKIIEIDGMKILFIGLITEEILAAAKQDAVGSFINTEEAAQAVGRICNTYNALDIDFTVLLTHIGIEEDKKLAHLLDPAWGVDMIIGGHSHTFMEEPVVENGIVIAHAGTGTDAIGRFDIVVDTDNNCIDSYTWEFVPVNSHTSSRDFQLEEIIRKYKSETDKKYQRVISHFTTKLTHPQRNMETALGNLFADIFEESLGVDIMLCGSGSIRTEEMGPIVTYGLLCESFPYDDGIYMIKVNGAMLRRMMLHILRDDAFLGHTEFYQVSKRFKMVYSKSAHAFKSFTFDGIEIEDEHMFTIGVQNFHFANIEDFMNVSYKELEAIQKPRVIATSCVNILEEYLTSHGNLAREIEGRITVLD